MSSTGTLYEKLGGQEAVEQVVNTFYDLILADERVKSFFANTDMKKQRRHQTSFVSFALGGPKEYTGRSMEKAHEGLNLQPDHFEVILEHLGTSLAQQGASEADINTVLERVETLRTAVLYH